jgi:hypothetical protein
MEAMIHIPTPVPVKASAEGCVEVEELVEAPGDPPEDPPEVPDDAEVLGPVVVVDTPLPPVVFGLAVVVVVLAVVVVTRLVVEVVEDEVVVEEEELVVVVLPHQVSVRTTLENWTPFFVTSTW